MFEINYSDGSTCSIAPYPVSCKDLTSGESACTSTTPPGTWDAMNNYCYGSEMVKLVGTPLEEYCTTNAGTIINQKKPIVKSIIPHKAIPQIVW